MHYVCIESFTKQTSSSINISLAAKNLEVFDELRAQASSVSSTQRSNFEFQDMFAASQENYLLNQFRNIDQVSIYKLFSDQIRIKDANQLHQN